jgi:pilus assembly protein CpaC
MQVLEENMKSSMKLSACLFVAVIALLTALSGSALAKEDNKYILFLKPGGSKILEIDNISKDIKVFISEGDIVHARPLKENKMYIRGKKSGYCTVTVWDKIKKEATAEIDVTVSYDLSGLKKQISIHFPNQDIKVYGADNGIVLSGTVTGPEIVEQVIRLAERFLPTIESGTSMVTGGEGGISISGDDDDEGTSDVSETGRTKTSINKITNLLNVSNIHQVLLEVKVAEVTRDSAMNWSAGVSYFKAGSDFGGFVNGEPRDGGSFIDWNNSRSGDDPSYIDFSQGGGGSIVTDFVGDFANLLLKVDNVGLALEFLEGEGLANTLAEPRLVALSGQEARFLAGGKFPYISSNIDRNGNRADKVLFEETGVSLKFTPIVQSNGLITLRVAPTISEVTDSISSPNGLLPLVDTRELETTAQLHDGQTLVLAGLLSESSRDSVNKVPLLGDLPVLGALFRSSAYQTEKTDLMITITPHLVTPTKEGLISYPGEFIKRPSRFEFYLLGKLEGMRYADDPSRISGHNFSLQTSGGLEGSFGHIEQ